MNNDTTQKAPSKRAQKIASRGYSLPLVLTCKVTGKQVKYTSPAYINKCLAKYGDSIERMKAEYVSREGKRQSAPAEKTETTSA